MEPLVGLTQRRWRHEAPSQRAGTRVCTDSERMMRPDGPGLPLGSPHRACRPSLLSWAHHAGQSTLAAGCGHSSAGPCSAHPLHREGKRPLTDRWSLPRTGERLDVPQPYSLRRGRCVVRAHTRRDACRPACGPYTAAAPARPVAGMHFALILMRLADARVRAHARVAPGAQGCTGPSRHARSAIRMSCQSSVCFPSHMPSRIGCDFACAND